MPNLTPVKYRQDYLLYENKPCLDEEAEHCKSCLETRIQMAGDTIAYGDWGDSRHFQLSQLLNHDLNRPPPVFRRRAARNAATHAFIRVIHEICGCFFHDM